MKVKIVFLVLVIFMTLQHTLSKKCKGKKKALCKEVDTLSDALATCQDESKELNNEIDELKATCQAESEELNNEIDELKATFNAEREELNNEIDKLNDTVEDQKAAIEQLETELEDCGPAYTSLGCFKDKLFDRAIPIMEGRDPLLDGLFYTFRQHAIIKCYQAALNRGYEVFALQNSGQCFSGPTAEQTYNKHGGSDACGDDGEGGFFANEAYEIKEPKVLPFKNLGCFKDKLFDRAIPSLEGDLHGLYKFRQNAIAKCYLAAEKRGYEVFAVQDSGQCFSGPTAEQTFNKHGGSDACGADGEGGFFANQAYEITGS